VLHENGADEPHDGFLIREDADDVGSALDLLIQPLQRIRRMQLRWLCCKDDRRRWEDGDKLDPISFMRRYRKER
jgi:hypothetical protein